MQEPEEVLDTEQEQVLARVAAIDVAKASGMVCTRMPHETVPGKRVTKVWQVKATTRALVELANHLRRQGIQRVVLESTSDYWRPFYYLLEARGVVVWLVNATEVKNVPGRPKDRQAGRGVAGQADRERDAPALVRPAPAGTGPT